MAAVPKAAPVVVPLADDQRAAETLSRADVNLKAGRYQEARNALQDGIKTGNTRVLVALAETYDPLILREQYPRLVRIGDVDRAIALYERARAAGATGMETRLSALKALR